MRWRWAAALWGLTATAALGAGLTIATYNIENYVAANRVIPDGYRRDYPKPEEAKAALRQVIVDLQADILILQEMGPRPYLRELQRDLSAEGLDYPVAILLEATDSERHVAVLSRYRFNTVRRHTELQFDYLDQPTSVKRGLLELVLSTDRGDVTLWALHLKSRYTNRKEDPESHQRRMGEAVAIRDFILARFPDPDDAQFLIFGDCNDTKRSAPVRYLLSRGERTIARLLPAEDSRGEHWTYYYRQSDTYSRVDHIMVSPGLMYAIVGWQARIHDGPGVLTASDHRPVIVTLALTPISRGSDQRNDEGTN